MLEFEPNKLPLYLGLLIFSHLGQKYLLLVFLDIVSLMSIYVDAFLQSYIPLPQFHKPS